MSKVTTQETVPIIFLLDLDQTLIGDIGPQHTEYYLIKDINKELKKVNKKQIRYNSKLLNEELEKYIIRPKLNKFIKNVKQYDNIELFIYTASGHQWANFLIPHIEKIIKFKFNRPILTNKNLVYTDKKTYKKSINNIKPIVFKSLKKKYYLKNKDSLKYISLIDNTKNILIENRYLINCVHFDYRHQINYLRMIPDNLLKKYYIIIEKTLNLDHSTNLYEFYSRYYDHLKREFNYSSEKNKQYLKDNYWYVFINILKNNIDNITYSKLIKLLKNINT